MEVGNGDETDQAALEEKERLDDGITSENPTETANDDDNTETDELKSTEDEEDLKDSKTVIPEKTKTEETEELAKDVENAESNEKSDVSDVNKELTPAQENKNHTEANTKKHPLIIDEDVTEPEAKKTKLEEDTKPEGEEVIIDAAESSALERPFPPEFYAEMESHECDPGPLWQFNDPYFIELVEEGNPPKDVSYVSLKSDKNKDD